jgi:hypothetical protein
VRPTDAVVLSLLTHAPPPIPSVSADVNPRHTFGLPAIAVGEVLTVTRMVAKQPVGMVKLIVGVPAATPVTDPPAVTVASVVLLLVHVPPVVTSVNNMLKPVHTIVVVPDIADGVGLTVIVLVTKQPVGTV